MQRREFLQQAGLSIGALSAVAAAAPAAPPKEGAPSRTEGGKGAAKPFQPHDWGSIREQFALTHSKIHMAMFLLASHPRPVSEAIERHRRALDANPAEYWIEQRQGMDAQQREAAAEYMGGSPNDIALTDSTTMGLGLIYGSLQVEPGEEMVCTTHCHYSTQMSLQHRAERTGAKVRQVALYADPSTTSVDEIVANTRKAIRDRTRVLAVTWVHSCTGVKLPIAAMSAAIREINGSRDKKDRVLFCVDGVHGFGIEEESIESLGCDFFMAGTHKWIFGPRGTGVIWGRPEAWQVARPVIPSFGPNYGVWLGHLSPALVPAGDLNTPGGFHSFEHRWALHEAFRFHQQIGKSRVRARIHALNTQTKEGLAGMSHIKLHTPMSAELSAGIICFEVEGMDPGTYVAQMLKEGIVASRSPYRVSYPRLSPSLLNNEEEIERSLSAVRALA